MKKKVNITSKMLESQQENVFQYSVIAVDKHFCPLK